MALFILINSVFVGTQRHVAGSVLNDAVDPTAAVAAAGGVLWPSSDATVAAAAQRARDLKLRGAPTDVIDRIMLAAVGGKEKNNAARRRIAQWLKDAADGAAATTTAEAVLYVARDAETVQSVEFTPAAALIADNANNATMTLRKRTAAGGDGGVVAALTTNLASGNWVQWVPKSLGAVANASLATGDSLTVAIAKTGTGVVVPQGVLSVSVLSDL